MPSNGSPEQCWYYYCNDTDTTNVHDSGYYACSLHTNSIQECDNCGGYAPREYNIAVAQTIHYSYSDSIRFGFCSVSCKSSYIAHELPSHRYCSWCDQYVDTNRHDFDFSDGYGDVVCDRCWESVEDEYPNRSDQIREYHDNPDYLFINDDGTYDFDAQPNQYYFGLEIEVEGASKVIDDYITLESGPYRHLWGCYDGSLDDGVEIITMPGTFDAFMDGHVIPWDNWDQNVYNGFGFDNDSHESSGLHVHVSRSAFNMKRFNGHRGYRKSAAHMYRFLEFLQKNEEAIYVLAEREDRGYCKWDKRKSRDERKQVVESRGYGDKYSAINTAPYETIEVRFFNGTCNPDKLKRAIQFLHAVIEYTRKGYPTKGFDRTSWKYFYRYVKAQHKLYPELRRFMRNHKDLMFELSDEAHDNWPKQKKTDLNVDASVLHTHNSRLAYLRSLPDGLTCDCFDCVLANAVWNFNHRNGTTYREQNFR